MFNGQSFHLKLAEDLSSDACIVVITNFLNRQGIPNTIRSDMNTNFVGVDNISKKTNDLFDWEYIKASLATKDIN